MPAENTVQQQIVRVAITPPKVDMDYDEAKAKLQTILAQYGKVVVTDENVAACKKMATEVNQMAEQLNRYRIDKIREARAPLDEADRQMKELVTMAKGVYEGIKNQTNRYDQVRLEIAEGRLNEARELLWKKHKVDEEYRAAEFDDLIKLGALTPKNDLAGAAFEKLEARVLRDKAKEDMVHMRLLALENRSFKAGLSTPLSREHVEAFLFSDDDVYEGRLEKLFERELAREAELKRRHEAEQKQAAERAEAEKAKAVADAVTEAEARTRREAAQAAQNEEQAKTPTAGEGEEKAAPEPAQDAPGPIPEDFTKWWVVVTYALHVQPDAEKADIVKGEREFLIAAGLSELHNVTAHKAGGD